MCLNKEAVLFNFLIIRFVGKEFRYQRGRGGTRAEEQFRSWARQGKATSQFRNFLDYVSVFTQFATFIQTKPPRGIISH